MSNTLRKRMIRITTRPGCDDEIEDLAVLAYVTDDIDTWGKRSILVEEGSGVYHEWYLFDDEWMRA